MEVTTEFQKSSQIPQPLSNPQSEFTKQQITQKVEPNKKPKRWLFTSLLSLLFISLGIGGLLAYQNYQQYKLRTPQTKNYNNKQSILPLPTSKSISASLIPSSKNSIIFNNKIISTQDEFTLNPSPSDFCVASIKLKLTEVLSDSIVVDILEQQEMDHNFHPRVKGYVEKTDILNLNLKKNVQDLIFEPDSVIETRYYFKSKTKNELDFLLNEIKDLKINEKEEILKLWQETYKTEVREIKNNDCIGGFSICADADYIYCFELTRINSQLTLSFRIKGESTMPMP